ncbi:MAG: hypothetical protein LBD15_02195 [Holosporales bacterium]|nr:hypothetical protein [Holosporales bacterium]
MNNTCKLLTSMTVLAAFCSGAMELHKETWIRERENGPVLVKEHLGIHLARMIETGNSYIDSEMATFYEVLFGCVDPGKEAGAPGGGTLVQIAAKCGRVCVLQAMVAAGVHVSRDNVVQCLLAVEPNDCNMTSFWQVTARLIAGVSRQTGTDTEEILTEVLRRTQGSPQHANLACSLRGVRSVLKQHGF